MIFDWFKKMITMAPPEIKEVEIPIEDVPQEIIDILEDKVELECHPAESHQSIDENGVSFFAELMASLAYDDWTFEKRKSFCVHTTIYHPNGPLSIDIETTVTEDIIQLSKSDKLLIFMSIEENR